MKVVTPDRKKSPRSKVQSKPFRSRTNIKAAEATRKLRAERKAEQEAQRLAKIEYDSEIICEKILTMQTQADAMRTNPKTMRINTETMRKNLSTVFGHDHRVCPSSQQEVLESAVKTLQTNADTWRTDAETLETQADTMRTIAETMQTHADTMRTNAKTTQYHADRMRTIAENTQTQADTWRTDAEFLQTQADTMRTNAETTQTEADTMRTNVETMLSLIKPHNIDVDNVDDGDL